MGVGAGLYMYNVTVNKYGTYHNLFCDISSRCAHHSSEILVQVSTREI